MSTEKEQNLQALENSVKISSLKRTSQVLVNLWELAHLVVGLKSGQCLVIDEGGSIFKGKVSTGRLQKLPDKVPGKKSLELDMNGREKVLTKWFVQSPSTAFKNAWDSQVLQEPKTDVSFHVHLFMLNLENNHDKVKHLGMVTDYNHKYIVLELYGTKGYFSADSGFIRFIETKDGVRYRANGDKV